MPNFELTSTELEHIEQLIANGKRNDALELVTGWHPRNLADLLLRLRFQYAQQLYDWLPDTQAGPLLPELHSTFRATLLGAVPLPKIVQLINQLDTDDAADVIGRLPDIVARKVVASLEQRVAVNKLLKYPANTAGGMMSAHYVSVPVDATIETATHNIREQAEHLEEVFAIFVTGPNGELEGSISLKSVLLTAPHIPVSDAMARDPVFVHPHVDRRQAALLMERYDLVALPVVDDQRQLIGCISIDDAVDVLQEEAARDISRLGGVPVDEEPTQPIKTTVQGRAPWLLAGLVGAAFSGVVIGVFEHTIEQAVVLASFIPIVMAMAGNAGIQSSAIAVQGLATGDVWSSDISSRLIRELSVATINGLIVAVAMFLAVLVLGQFVDLPNAGQLGITAGLALAIVILLAGMLGASAPLLLHRLGVDPTLATGPIITTCNDIIGVTVFFLTAVAVYLN